VPEARGRVEGEAGEVRQMAEGFNVLAAYPAAAVNAAAWAAAAGCIASIVLQPDLPKAWEGSKG